MAKKKVNKTEEAPLTLSELITYNQKVLLPVLDQIFKKNEKKLEEHDKEFVGIRKKLEEHDEKLDEHGRRLNRLQEDMMLSFDQVFKKIDILIEDRDYQQRASN
ncbi:hypothetical protein KKC60_04720 [Patescibacteria group bacterium]|nr:hypothetical protein [Patescibacteria group bacterium]